MDHISRFPDGVLHHFLSFLPTKDALRTSILSKRWKPVLDTYPIFDFSWGDCAGQSSDAMYSENASDEYRQMLTKFMNYVDTSIFRFCKYKLSMQKFKLFLVLPDLELSSHLDKWVQKVIENGVKEVDFGFDLPGYLHFKKRYNMPDAIFAAKSVFVLKLFGCNVKLEESFCIKLHSLQKLALKEVQMDDHLLRRIVTCCPLIEDISLRFCWGFKKIQVFELLRLKKFEIYSHLSKPESVEIKSPSLESFHCSFTVRSVKPIVSVDACQGLKSLILSGSFVTELPLQDLVPKFHVLESLRVGDCPVLKKVKI
ncbi:PREDICTED: F-box/LRR-repeat protein At4g14103-like [Populus euphratica]|uniref:F-box/LRR-repeat protein At4g14103-like n=1 Tax=Populus euphratica TaxID=75702 RepID=A0AAJ6X7P8_POPEU|nr:PREDICTED: F-box/LRR-repeat protein At4g14103-like [Populus euphratica]